MIEFGNIGSRWPVWWLLSISATRQRITFTVQMRRWRIIAWELWPQRRLVFNRKVTH